MASLFVFDMDNVLYDYDWRIRMAGLTELTGIELPELRRRWWHDGGEWAAEAGHFATGADYHAAFVDAIGMPITVEQWVVNRRSAMTPWPDSFAAVTRAAELGDIALLTNNGALAEEQLATLAPEIAPLFGDDLHTSSFYGARKPDPAVFAELLRRHDADPAEVFFADDLAGNVEGAASVGITAHRFEHAAGLRAAIEAFASSR